MFGIIFLIFCIPPKTDKHNFRASQIKAYPHTKIAFNVLQVPSVVILRLKWL